MVKGKRGDQAMPDPQKPEGRPPKDHNEKGAAAAGPALLITDQDEMAGYYFDVTRGVLGIRSEIEVLQEEIAGLKTAEKQWFKEAKARLGMNREDIEYGLKLRTDEDGKTRIAEARRRQMIAGWEEHPLAQIEMNFDVPNRTPSVDRAHEAGKLSGLNDKARDPPSHYGHEQAQSWMAGWNKGNEALVESRLKAMKPLEPEAPTDQEKMPDDQQIDERTGEPREPEPIGTAESTAEQV